jgi:lysophospholipase L1-like esterase
MKKALSIILSAALAVTALCTPAYAETETTAQSNSNILAVFGDSIASGYGLDDSEYRYSEICADYLGWEEINYAHSGDDISDLYTLLTENPDAAAAAANAEVIVVSIGANDIISAALTFILEYAAKNDLLKDGKTSDDIPDEPGMSALEELLDQSKLKTYLQNDLNAAGVFISQFRKSLIGTSGAIPTAVIPETQELISTLTALNSDADIIFQTIYQPMEFSTDYWNEKFVDGDYKSYSGTVNLLRSILEDVMTAYQTQLTALTSDFSQLKIADVYSEFKSVEKTSIDQQGYAYYFTNIQTSGEERDFHPNQRGHLAIACSILEQIGQLHDTDADSLLRTVYSNAVSDGSEYPAMAYETYLTVAGNEIVPAVTTTTTTTSSTQTQVQTTTSTQTSTNITETTTSPAGNTEPTQTVSLGDVNEDGNVDALDASLILTEYALIATGNDSSFSEAVQLAADVNSDGAIDALDASVVLSYYAYTATGGTSSVEEFLQQ